MAPKGVGYVARGFRGTKGRSQLQKDILAKRDKAKRAARREKDLESNVAENQRRIKAGKKARTISERDLDRTRTPVQRIRRMQAKAADLRERANEVDRSGTGNKKAAATYRQTAALYLKQAAAIRKDK